MDEVFTMLSEDPVMGPRLQRADVPQRFAFTDVDLVVHVRPARADEAGCLHWTWENDVDWSPRVQMSMTAQIACAYFQGRENIACAIARRRIAASGDVHAALAILPMTKPVFARFGELVARRHPHLRA